MPASRSVAAAVAATATAALAASCVVLVAGLVPAHGAAPRVVSGDGATSSPTPTGTSTGVPTAEPVPAQRLLPDLVTLPARKLYLEMRETGRRLRFASSLGNAGAGPLEVRPNQNRSCPEGQHNSTQVVFRDTDGDTLFSEHHDTGVWRHQAGCMLFHPKHDHWHFKASARYTLFAPDAADTVISARRKVSFCLRDTDRLPERYGTFDYPEAYGACSRRSPQGISVGWMDVYQNNLAGQALPLPPDLPDGLYCLRTVVDPINQLVESDDGNNTSVKALEIRKDRVIAAPSSSCL